MPGTILVTGAAGFAGSHLVELLSRDGCDVVAWHRPGGEKSSDVQAGISSTPTTNVRWDAIDLLDPAGMGEAITRLRPSTVYHCAGAAHAGRSWDSTVPTFSVNVRGTHHLLEALRLTHLDVQVIIPSSAMVYASANEALTEDHDLRPSNPYALSKLAQELLGCRAIADGVRVKIARAFNHLGPGQNPLFVASGFAQQIAHIEADQRKPEIAVGNLDARRDLTDVRDTVRAYRLIGERGQPGRPYNVCTGRIIAVRELLDLLLARARVPIRVRVDPARYRPNDVPLLLGDPGRIRDELGWAPEIPLERTLDDVLEYWRKRSAQALGS